MNARKHRELQQATRDWLRLEPKGTHAGSEPVTCSDANTRRPVYRANLNHPVSIAEHGKAVSLVPVWLLGRPYRKAGRRNSIGMTEKAKASGNALDMPTSVWSEMAREQAEPHTNRRKQMTTDACRLMRPGVAAPKEHNAQRLPVRIAKLPAHRTAGRSIRP